MTEPSDDDLNKYVVYLAVPMQALTPEAAVAGMINVLNERGLINWVYRADTAPTDLDQPSTLVGYYNGHGQPITSSTGPEVSSPEPVTLDEAA